MLGLMNLPPTESAARAVESAWTRPLKWWFVGLQVAGIYGVAAFLLVASVGEWMFLAVVSYFLRSSTPAFSDAAGAALGGIFGQPALGIAVLVGMIVASVFITRGAFRHQAWAHWGAIALVAVSTLPVIQIAVVFHELAIWIVALAYCAGCAAFVAAMTYALVKHGPWGVPAQKASW
jgi:hypothetical protein